MWCIEKAKKVIPKLYRFKESELTVFGKYYIINVFLGKRR